MKLLYFLQEEKNLNIGLFDDFKDIKKFIKKLLNIEITTFDDIYHISFYRDSLKDYEDIEINGNLIPISKYAFAPYSEIYFGLCKFKKILIFRIYLFIFIKERWIFYFCDARPIDRPI